MEVTLTKCRKCYRITGCEITTADGNGVIQKLCYQTCPDIPTECEVRYMTFKSRIAELCPKCDWEAEKNED